MACTRQQILCHVTEHDQPVTLAPPMKCTRHCADENAGTPVHNVRVTALCKLMLQTLAAGDKVWQ
jgi:hypothetical protein